MDRPPKSGGRGVKAAPITTLRGGPGAAGPKVPMPVHPCAQATKLFGAFLQPGRLQRVRHPKVYLISDEVNYRENVSQLSVSIRSLS